MCIFLLIPEKLINNVAAIKKGRPTVKVTFDTVNVLNNEGIPTTSAELNMFDPKIFPKLIPKFFFIAAVTVTTNSGKLVPIANAVMDNTPVPILNIVPKLTIESTVNLAPM